MIKHKSHSGILHFDKIFNVKYISDSFFQLTGILPKDIIDNDFLSFIHPEDIAQVKDSIADFIADKCDQGIMQIRIKYADDSWRAVIGTFTNLLPVENIAAISVYFSDTEKEKQQHQEEEILFKEIIEHSPSAIVLLDKKFNFKYISGSTKRITGYAPEDMVGIDSSKLVHPDDKEAIDIKLMDLIATPGATMTEHYRYLFADGSWRYIESTFSNLLHVPGVEVLAINYKDIDDLKKAEIQLLEFNERFNTISKTSQDAFWDWNLITDVVWWSQAYYTTFGLSADKPALHFSDLFNHIHATDAERIYQSIENIPVDKPTGWEDEIRFTKKDGSSGFLFFKCIVIYDNSVAVRIIGSLIDITEMKLLQTKLLDQQRKEQQRISAVVIKAQENERNAIGQELHDNFSQRLIALRLTLFLMKQTADGDTSKIDQCLENLEMLVLENRRISHKLVTPDFSVSDFAKKIDVLLSEMFQPVDLKYIIDANDFDQTAIDDLQKITVYRIIQEQTTNIIKYATGATIVTIKMSTDDNLFNLNITDNGNGSDLSKNNHNGIGLRNMKNRLKIFGGNISTNSEKGKYFTLEVNFPLTAEQD